MRNQVLGVCTACLMVASVGAQRAQSRYAAMDTNRDGVVTRSEWRGSDEAFRANDWNGDGRLSGDELRPAARRPARGAATNPADSVEEIDDWSAENFAALDRNRDRRLSRTEWQASRELFTRLDRNGDGTISETEFSGEDTAGPDRPDRFREMDVNRDGRVTRDEWRSSRAVFDALDENRDGVLTRAEAEGSGAADDRDEFASVDVNRDGRISSDEWSWNQAAFRRLDSDGNGTLSRREFDAQTSSADANGSANASPAYRAGYQRGHQDGVQAGREDKQQRNRWDLEGQRELEQADAGYVASVGARDQFQSGYRGGFRAGYSEGFGPR